MAAKDMTATATEEEADQLGAEAGGEAIASQTTGYAERPVVRAAADPEHVFRFEMGAAILQQLLQKLPSLKVVPLTLTIKAPYVGFYQLRHDGQDVYIGKTSRTIEARLREHYRKLFGRKGISLAKMECRYAFVMDASLVDVSEKELIDHFANQGMAVWNKSGFGSKVWGYRRRYQDPSEWDKQYPPNLEVPIELDLSAPERLYKFVTAIASTAPVTLSIPDGHKKAFKSAHKAIDAPYGKKTLSFQQWVTELEQRLEPPWKILRFPEAMYIVDPTKG